MKANSKVGIIDVTENHQFERFLYRCIFHRKRGIPANAPYQKHEDRNSYLEFALPRGLGKKVLFLEKC